MTKVLDALQVFDGVTAPAAEANDFRAPYTTENGILAAIDYCGLDADESASLRRIVARKVQG